MIETASRRAFVGQSASIISRRLPITDDALEFLAGPIGHACVDVVDIVIAVAKATPYGETVRIIW